MQLKLIACEVFYRELCHLVARSPNQVDIEFVPKGLHDLPSGSMQERLQAVVDRVDDPRYDAILLGYGLCNNGLANLKARTRPLIIPRAHDCISLFMGSSQRYLDYFNDHPGVYFKTSGWIERGQPNGELKQLSIQQRSGMDMSYEALVEKYGEENAQYLKDMLLQTQHYGQITFIEMGIEPDGRFEASAREAAQTRGWKFEKMRGDLGLLERLVNGPWDPAEFLTVQPGQRVVARVNACIIDAEPDRS